MHRFLLFILMTLVSIHSIGQNETQSDWDIQGLKGSVSGVRTDGYFLIQDASGLNKGLPIPGINYHTMDSFNVGGFLLRSEWYNADTIYRMNMRDYSGDLEIRTRTYLGRSLVEDIRQEWYPNGELSAQWKLDSSGDTSRSMLNVMDSSMRIVRSYQYTRGELFEKIFFEYDRKGNMTTSSSYDINDELVLRIDFEYDREDKMIAMQSWSPVLDQGGWFVDTNMIWEEQWTYIDSMLTEYRSIDYDLGEEVRSLFSYSTQGQLYKKETFVNDELSELQIWDPKTELIIRHDFYGHGGLLNTEWSFEYSFDEQGNWTEQLMIRDGIPERIIERRLNYF